MMIDYPKSWPEIMAELLDKKPGLQQLLEKKLPLQSFFQIPSQNPVFKQWQETQKSREKLLATKNLAGLLEKLLTTPHQTFPQNPAFKQWQETQKSREKLLAPFRETVYTVLQKQANQIEKMTAFTTVHQKFLQRQDDLTKLVSTNNEAASLPFATSIAAINAQLICLQKVDSECDFLSKSSLYRYLNVEELGLKTSEVVDEIIEKLIDSFQESLETVATVAVASGINLNTVKKWVLMNLINLNLIAILFGWYFFLNSASKEDIQVVQQDIKVVQQSLQDDHREEAEKRERIEAKIAALLAALEKELPEQVEPVVPMEMEIYMVITDNVQVREQPTPDSTLISELVVGELVIVVKQECEWCQILFLDYLNTVAKTGWIPKGHLKPLTLPESEEGTRKV